MHEQQELSSEGVSPGSVTPRILILDEDKKFKDAAVAALKAILDAADVVVASTMSEYAHALDENDFDLVVVDFDMPDTQRVDFLPRLRLRDYDPEVLLISKCDRIQTVRLIAEARSRYIVRDERCIEAMKHAVKDILRIRRLEAENSVIRARLIEANGMLDEKNRRLDEFCATIAHDIRGPLSGLILKLDYILDTFGGELNERFSSLLQRSLESAERLVGVVQAMYEFAKVGAKSTKMELVDLSTLVASVVSDLPVDPTRDVQVGVDELPMVWGNSNLLRRVFINLITNAIKYNDKPQVRINIGYGGEVSRAVARYVQVFVEDNGPGIPSEDSGRIFEMFTRGRSQGPQHQDGLGIGLSVVQKIIELHFGRVELERSPGGGCKFIFTLPREKVELS